MATEVMNKRSTTMTSKKASVPRGTLARVEEILAGNYAFMDSPVFKNRNIEKELFTFAEEEPKLPLTSWYQPTREEIADQLSGNPQLMKAPEERLMFRRFNFAKRKLGRAPASDRRLRTERCVRGRAAA